MSKRTPKMKLDPDYLKDQMKRDMGFDDYDPAPYWASLLIESLVDTHGWSKEARPDAE